jgi:hypothetical protein
MNTRQGPSIHKVCYRLSLFKCLKQAMSPPCLRYSIEITATNAGERKHLGERHERRQRQCVPILCKRLNVIMISRRLHHINLRMRTSTFFMKRWESRVTVQGENHLYQNCWMHKWIDWDREWHILPFSKIVDKSLQMCCLQCQIHLTTVDYHQFIICIEESINKRILHHLSRWKL